MNKRNGSSTEPTLKEDTKAFDKNSKKEFKETKFDDSPKVYPIDDGSSSTGPSSESIKTQTYDVSNKEESEFDKIKEESAINKIKKDESKKRPGSDASFNIGAKKISADPKVIARAVRTVLHKDD